MAYSGIDYGNGLTNIDNETGIRYGVIHSNKLASHAWDEITTNGKDLDYAEAIENLKSELSRAIASVMKDYATSNFDANEAAQDVIDSVDFEIESTGDCTRYSYSKDGEEFTVGSDGDIFVTKSKHYTLCQFCSPCAPGAGSLGSEGSVKTYCLGPDWFDEYNPMPYECFPVDGTMPRY